MTTALQSGGGGGLARQSASSLADVLDTILDRGLVIDAYVRVSLVGIEILTIDARVVVASVDTYLRFAKAVNRLDIDAQKPGIPEIIEGIATRGAKSKTEGALEGLGDKLNEILGPDADPDRIAAVGQQLLQQLSEGNEQKNTTTNRRRTK